LKLELVAGEIEVRADELEVKRESGEI